MIARAKERAADERSHARFICADAQIHAFEARSFDLIVSRFGVMFFDDPVRAFSNLRHAADRGAALEILAWRTPAENPFMTEAERAAARFLPPLPPRTPNEPGQFGFADRNRVHSILTESGWVEISIDALDVECTLKESELRRYITHLGPLGRVLPRLDEQARRQVIDAVRAAFDRYVHRSEVRFQAACWAIAARSNGGR
jgi:SAM-dependent methyltransferase